MKKSIEIDENINIDKKSHCKSGQSATLAHHLGPIFGLVIFITIIFTPAKCGRVNWSLVIRDRTREKS